MRKSWLLSMFILCAAIISIGQGCGTGFSVSDSVNIKELSSENEAPQFIPSKSQALSFGSHHTCNLNSQNELYCWGRGYEGEVGDPAMKNHDTAYKVPTSLRFTVVTTGTHTSCALSTENSVYCFGRNKNGVLGLEENGNTAELNKIFGLPPSDTIIDLGLNGPFNLFTEHIKVGASPAFACALTEAGEVWCWGSNEFGQLGFDPQQVTHSSIALKVPDLNQVQSISVGAGHVCALSNQNRVYCWGNNHAGQIDVNSNQVYTYLPTEIVFDNFTATQVKAGGGFNCALSASGSVYCWGRNKNVELGIGKYSNKESPQLVSLEEKIVNIELGLMNACAISDSKKAYCWGDNWSGQLANGSAFNSTPSPALMPTSIGLIEAMTLGTFSMCGLNTDNQLYCWGHAYFGEQGAGQQGDGDFGRTPALVKNFSY